MRKTKLKQNIAQTMRKLFLLVAVAAVTVCGMHAQMMPQITPDAQYRIGKLDNGLTYYIRHNEYPKDVADFYIAQRVGSIQERTTSAAWLISLSTWRSTVPHTLRAME